MHINKNNGNVLEFGKWKNECELNFVLPKNQNEGHRVYNLKNGDLEWEVTFESKPSSNIYRIPINLKNIDARYQPEDILKRDNIVCEDNVYGSYALYHSSRKHGYYKTGKVGHIYRPELIDAGGHRAWCDMEIKDGQLLITMPQDFLNTAVYPIILDPTIGYTDIGASAYSDFANWAHYYLITMPEDGTLTGISSCCYRYVAGSVYHAIYDDSSSLPNSLVEEETTGYVPPLLANDGFHETSMAGTTSLTNGTSYWIATVVKPSQTNDYDFRIQADYHSYHWGGHARQNSGTNAFPSTAGASLNDYDLSIYATYTAAGAAATGNKSVCSVIIQ